MKSKIIGNFIKEIRLKNNKSEEEIANKLNIDINDYIKLENGKKKITTKIINELKNIYITDSKSKKNSYTYNVFTITEYEIKKIQKFNYIILTLIAIITAILISSGIYFINNRSFIYNMYGESESFSFNNSIFIFDGKSYHYMFGDLKIKNTNIQKDDIISVTLKCNDRLIIRSNTFLTGSTRENKGYDELFPNEVVKNLDNWYYEIEYKTNEGTLIETININSKKV